MQTISQATETLLNGTAASQGNLTTNKDQSESTLALSSKTTEQVQKGLPSLETRTVAENCGKHGLVEINQARLRGSEWGPIVCHVCASEKEAEDQKQIADYNRQMTLDSRRIRAEYLLGRSGMPARFSGRDFDSYIADGGKASQILSICREYAQNFPDRKKLGQSIILCGITGTGKTHLACAIANHIIYEHQSAVVYATASRAFRVVKDTFRRDSKLSEQEAITQFSTPDLLILDEIGVQYGSETELNILFDIINERYERMRPTILISNLALPKLTEYAGDRVIDRMKENGGKLLVFDWKSHRGSSQ